MLGIYSRYRSNIIAYINGPSSKLAHRIQIMLSWQAICIAMYCLHHFTADIASLFWTGYVYYCYQDTRMLSWIQPSVYQELDNIFSKMIIYKNTADSKFPVIMNRNSGNSVPTFGCRLTGFGIIFLCKYDSWCVSSASMSQAKKKTTTQPVLMRSKFMVPPFAQSRCPRGD